MATSKGAVNAINARATTKNGKTSVVAINLTDKSVQFELKFDNVNYVGSFKHEALIYNNVGVVSPTDFYEDPLTIIKQGAGIITLPPLSISKITNIVLDPNVKLIAGTIEAEEFKLGGEGVGYSDTTVNNTLSAGDDTDGVDVGVSNSITYVGDTQNGEWLKYDVNVLQDGIYDFEFVYSAASAGALVDVEVDDVILFDTHSLLQTGNENDYRTSKKENVTLKQGIHELKVNIQNGGFNLDKINVSFIAPPAAPNFVTLTDGFILEPGLDLEVEATSTENSSKINSLALYLDDVLVRSLSTAPFKWGFDGQNDAVLENMVEGIYTLKLVLTDDNAQTSESIITVNVKNFALQPYGGSFHQVPGTIQFEDYDIGGEGLAFHDTSIGNTGGAYRIESGEDVDVSADGSGFVTGSLSGGEYTRYSINVAEAGSYEMVVNYKTFSSNSKPFSVKLLTSDLAISKDLFLAPAGSTTTGIIKIGAGIYGDYTSPKFDLQAGNAVLELHIPSGGAGPNYDYVTLNKVGTLSTDKTNLNVEKLKIFPVPSNTGKFNLSKTHQWKVFTVIGTLIKKGEGKEVDISSFSKGMYLLKTSTGEIKRLIYN